MRILGLIGVLVCFYLPRIEGAMLTAHLLGMMAYEADVPSALILKTSPAQGATTVERIEWLDTLLCVESGVREGLSDAEDLKPDGYNWDME